MGRAFKIGDCLIVSALLGEYHILFGEGRKIFRNIPLSIEILIVDDYLLEN